MSSRKGHTKTTTVPETTSTCAKCRRAVSGFPGDYARCSSCKQMTQLPLEPPRGWRLIRDPAKLSVMPFYFVLLFYASIVSVAWTGGGTDIAGGAVVIVVFTMWIFSIMQFSKTAERQKRWWAPVLLYHAVSLAIPICMWLGVQGCSPILKGTVSAMALLKSASGFVGLLVCLLLYGAARGRLARLRIIRED